VLKKKKGMMLYIILPKLLHTHVALHIIITYKK